MGRAEEIEVSEATERTPLRRVVAASMIGTTIEWYDFFLYNSAAALVFNRLFFPQFDPLTGTLLAFATYALGFVARPLGGIVFGHYGDRIGRKRLLMLSLILMGVATVLIGLLPTYDAIGIWAPLALIVLRLAQGFAVGGEWGGAVLMAAEHGDAARRGFWASWPQAGVAAGFLLAAGMLAAINALQSEADFLAWGWRVPFLLSVLLVAVGWYIRNKVAESRLFEEAQSEAEAPPRMPALDVFRERPKAVLLGAGLRVGENISYYILTAFSLTFLVDISAQSRGLALNALMIGAAGAILRHSLVRAALGQDRPAAGLCLWRLRPRRLELRALPAAGERRRFRDRRRARRRPRPARRDVRAAGGDDRRAFPDPHPLFRRLDRLSADRDLRRLAGADHRRLALSRDGVGDAGRALCRGELRDQRRHRLAGARDEGHRAGRHPLK